MNFTPGNGGYSEYGSAGDRFPQPAEQPAAAPAATQAPTENKFWTQQPETTPPPGVFDATETTPAAPPAVTPEAVPANPAATNPDGSVPIALKPAPAPETAATAGVGATEQWSANTGAPAETAAPDAAQIWSPAAEGATTEDTANIPNLPVTPPAPSVAPTPEPPMATPPVENLAWLKAPAGEPTQAAATETGTDTNNTTEASTETVAETDTKTVEAAPAPQEQVAKVEAGDGSKMLEAVRWLRDQRAAETEDLDIILNASDAEKQTPTYQASLRIATRASLLEQRNNPEASGRVN